MPKQLSSLIIEPDSEKSTHLKTLLGKIGIQHIVVITQLEQVKSTAESNNFELIILSDYFERKS